MSNTNFISPSLTSHTTSTTSYNTTLLRLLHLWLLMQLGFLLGLVISIPSYDSVQFLKAHDSCCNVARNGRGMAWTTFQPAAQLLDSPPILPSTQQTPPQSPKEPRQPPPPPSLLNHPPLPPPACVTLTATTDDQLLLTAAQQHYANKPTDPPPLRHVDYPITANMRLCAEAYVCVCWYKVAQTFIRLCNDAPDLRVLCCHHLIDSRHHHPACCLVTYPHQL
eukprot:GHVS01061030.1.p1 GENE.GHVS01061030.1~~GHVS01061030.1.p1  ORF type:complete len:222 (-),score=47.03 GHVS01061030.1:1350-2015(-)